MKGDQSWAQINRSAKYPIGRMIGEFITALAIFAFAIYF